MASMACRRALIEFLKQEKVEYVFGLPGSTNLLFLDALEDCPEIKYILALHETAALGIAQGYARFSGRVGVVSLHSLTGLSAALPLLFNAFWEKVPLVILAGVWETEAARSFHQPAAHIVALAHHCTKWRTAITGSAYLLPSLRKAFRIALQPPFGPVLLALPQSILTGSVVFDPVGETGATTGQYFDDVPVESENNRLINDVVSRLTFQLKKQVKPNSISRLMLALQKQIQPGTIIVEESPSYTADVQHILAQDKNMTYFNVKPGRSIGDGLPNAIGARLAAPGRPVIAVIGDGSAIWSFQSLWTAAHYQVPVTFIITANAGYRVLKTVKIGQFGIKARGRYLGLDINDPELDFCQMAQSLGVAAIRIARPEEIGQALKRDLCGRIPYLIEVNIQEEL
jgi:thiamine pyrophosphate-dependent acetolactate synthase large subunit-like protein